MPTDIAASVRRYLRQMALSLRPESAYQEKTRLFRFFSWLARANPEVTRIEHIQRCHVEAYKEYIHWAPLLHKSNGPGDVLSSATRYHLLAALYYFLSVSLSGNGRRLPRGYWYFPGTFRSWIDPLRNFWMR